MGDERGTASLTLLCLAVSAILFLGGSTPAGTNTLTSLTDPSLPSNINIVNVIPQTINHEEPEVMTVINKALIQYPASSTLSASEISNIGSHFTLIEVDPIDTNLSTLKASYPAVTVLGYKDLIGMLTSYSDWATVNANEAWFLHTAGGARLRETSFGWYLMDPASAAWRTYFIGVVNTKLAAYGYDGIFLDDVRNSAYNISLDGAMQAADINSWHADIIAFLTFIKANITPGKLVYINMDEWSASTYVATVDGEMLEGFTHSPWMPTNDQTDRDTGLIMAMIDKLVTDVAAGKKVWCVSGAAGTSNQAETDRVVKFGYAGFLMGADFTNAYWGFNSSISPDGSKGYYSLMDTDLGTASGVYYAYQNIYRRNFSGGVVLFNPSSVSRYVTLSTLYKLLDGSIVSGVTVPAYSGEILQTYSTAPPTWTLTISAGANGSVNPTGAQTYNVSSSPVYVYAYPNSGYQLAHWVYDGTNVAAVNPYPVASGASGSTHTLAAAFSLIPTWTLNASAGVGGAVSDASQTAQLSIPLSVTATPDVDFSFSGWTLNGSSAGTTNPKTVTSGGSTAPQTLAASFTASAPEAATWILYVISEVGGYTDAPNQQTVAVGATVDVTATANADYTFTGWLLDGAAAGTTNPYTAADDGNDSRTLQALFNYTPVAPPSASGLIVEAYADTALANYSRANVYWPLFDNELLPKLKATTLPTFNELKAKLLTRY